MLCAKFQNDWSVEIDGMVERKFANQDVFSIVSYILMAPSTHNISVHTHNFIEYKNRRNKPATYVHDPTHTKWNHAHNCFAK